MTNEIAHILFVDDEPQMLSALKRVFRGEQYSVDTANSGAEALELIKNTEYDVIISDMRMPEMDGAAFLAEAYKKQPNTKRILLTGYADHDSTVRAINEGKVHQYLNKPWDNTALRELVDRSIEDKRNETSAEGVSEAAAKQLKDQVALVSQELDQATTFVDLAREELLNQYTTTIKIMSNLANLRLQGDSEMNEEIVRHSVAIAKALKLDDKVVGEIRNAARLYQIGKIAFSDTLLRTPIEKLNAEQQAVYMQHPELAADTLMPLEPMSFCAMLIRHQNENSDGTGTPSRLKGNEIPLGSRILRIVIDFHQLIYGVYFGIKLSVSDAQEYLIGHAAKKYDPVLVQIYTKLLKHLKNNSSHKDDHMVAVDDLQPNMLVTRDLLNTEGMLLIAKQTVLSAILINKLKAYVDKTHRELRVFVKKTNEEENNQV
ncbi:MAG: response regulator [Oceanospirillaceae bacterium]|nr:response regulator [Oceanospirillaceae bacterium]MCP5349739.1 response regulator [Oceanospirillaceae bacterium]